MKKPTCKQCDKKFETQKGLYIHERRMHYQPTPPPPRSTTETLPPRLLEGHNLRGGDKLELGDVFYRVEKLVIKSITKTEGTDTVNVRAELLHNYWTLNKPTT